MSAGQFGQGAPQRGTDGGRKGTNEQADDIGAPEVDPSDVTAVVGGMELTRVTRIHGTLPWDVDKDRNACGNTYVNGSAKTNWTVTIEAKVALSELAELLDAVDGADEVQVTTSEKRGATVSLDTLQYERTDDMDSVTLDDGTVEPFYKIQVMTQEQGDEQTGPEPAGQRVID